MSNNNEFDNEEEPDDGNDDRVLFLPTPERIKRMTLEIQEGWDEYERARRAGMLYNGYGRSAFNDDETGFTVPEVRAYHEG